MACMPQFLAYFGLGNGAELEVLNNGKRRTVTFLSLIAFALTIAAIVDDYWIVGGLEVAPSDRRRMLSEASIPEPEFFDAPHGRSLQTSGVKLDFYIGLKTYIQDYQGDPPYPRRSYYVNRTVPLSVPRIKTQTIWPLTDYIPYFNQLANTPGNYISGRTAPTGVKPLKASIFDDTYGLLVTAAFFGVCVWLGMVLVNHGIPQVVAYRWTFHIIGGGSIASAFFTMVAVALFGNSGMKNEFCSIFDPGADYNTLPCGFGDGFNYAIAGLFFSLLLSLLFFFWMPHAAGAAKYEFSEVGKGFGEGASEAPKAAMYAASSGGGGTSSSGYQDI